MTVGLCKLQASSYSAFERIILAALKGHNFNKAALLVVLLCKIVIGSVSRPKSSAIECVSCILFPPCLFLRPGSPVCIKDKRPYINLAARRRCGVTLNKVKAVSCREYLEIARSAWWRVAYSACCRRKENTAVFVVVKVALDVPCISQDYNSVCGYIAVNVERLGGLPLIYAYFFRRNDIKGVPCDTVIVAVSPVRLS